MYINFKDTIDGLKSRAILVYKGTVQELMHLVSFTLNSTVNEVRGYTIGNNVEGSKPAGVSHTGTLVAYMGDPLFLDMLVEYQNTNVKQEGQLTIINDDASSAFGRQSIVLAGFSIVTYETVKTDIGNKSLQQSMGFTCDRITPLERFKGGTAGAVTV